MVTTCFIYIYIYTHLYIRVVDWGWDRPNPGGCQGDAASPTHLAGQPQRSAAEPGSRCIALCMCLNINIGVWCYWDVYYYWPSLSLSYDALGVWNNWCDLIFSMVLAVCVWHVRSILDTKSINNAFANNVVILDHVIDGVYLKQHKRFWSALCGAWQEIVQRQDFLRHGRHWNITSPEHEFLTPNPPGHNLYITASSPSLWIVAISAAGHKPSIPNHPRPMMLALMVLGAVLLHHIFDGKWLGAKRTLPGWQ